MTSGKVTPLVGNKTSAYVDGQGQKNASFFSPTSISMDARARFAVLVGSHLTANSL
jgi:hypothetical protein